MDSLPCIANSPRKQSGAFATFHFAQKGVFHVATILFIFFLHLGCVGMLLDLHLAAWHNLGCWEALWKLSQCIGRRPSLLGV